MMKVQLDLLQKNIQLNKGALKKRFIHLTNYSVNKKADNYKKNDLKTENQGEDQNRQV